MSKKTCVNGHPMEPSWNICPYCPGSAAPPPTDERQALKKTVREVAPGVAERPDEPAPRKTVRLSERRSPVVGWLVDLDGQQKGEDFRIEEGKVLIGPAPDCQVRIENSFASEHHASLRYDSGAYILTDLDSTNGTLVNGVPAAKVQLKDGDRIKIGETTYMFKGLFL